jgi:hypothetical protein
MGFNSGLKGLRMIKDAFCVNKYIYLLQSCTTVNKSSRLTVLAHNEAITTSTHSLERTKTCTTVRILTWERDLIPFYKNVIKYDQKGIKN